MSCVLVVDDDPTILKMYRIVLGSAGFNVITASDGEEGLMFVREYSPNVVVLDLQMPGMDGWTMFRQLSGWPHRPPVLICSSFKAEQSCEEMGAEGSLAKPFDPVVLVDKVEHLIGVS